MAQQATTAATGPQDVEPHIVHIGEIRLEIGETSAAGETPRGSYFYVPILGGYFNTVHPLPEGFGIPTSATATRKPLHADILQGGSDYPLIYENKLAEINVSVVARARDSGRIFRITSHGLCEWDSLVWAMMRGDEEARSSAFGEVNSWQVFRVNTDCEQFSWLNFACIIGQERLIYDGRRLAATHMKLYQFLVR